MKNCFLCGKEFSGKAVEFGRPGDKGNFYAPLECWRNGSHRCVEKQQLDTTKKVPFSVGLRPSK